MIDQEQLNILWMLVAATLVLSMQIGFCLLETGLVRSKNSINVAVKNLADLCLSTVVFWVVGFGLMFGNSIGGWIGGDYYFWDSSDPWLHAFFVFQLVFCGTAITIISGAVAERTRFKGYLFIALLTSGLIYPVFGHWAWGGLIPNTDSGWLAEKGFIDFAGSTVVHSVGGWVALAAILVIGPRLGKFDDPDRKIQGHNLPLASAGAIILWFGWLGFNGGSTLGFNEQVPHIIANTVLAGAFGGVAAITTSYFFFGMTQTWAIINGIIAGLVGITACCHVVSAPNAALVGLVSGILCFAGMHMLEKLKVDDAVGAVSAHGVCGAWGTLAVALLGNPELFGTGLNRGEQLSVQVFGVVVAFAWSFGVAILFFFVLNKFVSLRVSREHEIAGLNVSEHGASTELIDLITEMSHQQQAGKFNQRVSVEPHTEVGQIAKEYNRVLDRVEREFKKRETAVHEADQAKEEALRANKVKSEFLANMSHELRTPLGIISGYTEILREDFKDTGLEEHDEYFETMNHSVDYLLGLINGVLDISKIESGEMTVHLEPIEVRPILEAIIKTFDALTKENHNELTLEIQGELGIMVSDQTKLQQCLLNLLSNANKFTENGKITLSAERTTQSEWTEAIRFRVSDTGIGMTSEQQERIFDAFTQADGSTTRKYGGTGLGLSITKSFCELLYGSIQVESELGKGSTFTIELPDNSQTFEDAKSDPQEGVLV